MILNEDYFDDIEITDDVINQQFDSLEPSKMDTEQLINYIQTKYTNSLCFSMEHGVPDQLPMAIRQLKNRLFAVLDFYNIEHTELFMYELDRRVYSNRVKLKLYDRKDYKVFAKKRNIDNINDHLYIFTYVNFPEMNINTAIKVIKHIINIGYSEKLNYNQYINRINLFPKIMGPRLFCLYSNNLPLDYSAYRLIQDGAYDYSKHYIEVIKYFFGDKRAAEIEEIASNIKD